MDARPVTRRRRPVLAGLITAAATLAASGVLLGMAPVARAASQEPAETCPAGLRLDGLSALGHLNAVRARNGRAPLAESSDLMSIAAAHSAVMARSGSIFHNPDLTSEVPNWEVVGENVGSGGSVSAIDACFDYSPEHFANEISTAYTQVGIGIASAGGVVYITVDFRKPMYATPAPAPVRRTVAPPAPTRTTPIAVPTSTSPQRATPAAPRTSRPDAVAVREAALRAAAARALAAQRERVAAVRAAAAHQAAGAGTDPVGRALSFSRTLTAMAG